MTATGRAFTASAPRAARNTAHGLAVTRGSSAACTCCLNWPQLMASALGVG
jgi:hypothetical protein